MKARTHTGRSIDIPNMTTADISIFDIAHALSLQCRFNGHTSHFYSVAQHSIRVAMAVPAHLRLAALLHDASEAYLGDVITPVKLLLPGYVALEAQVTAVIMQAFGVPVGQYLSPEIAAADARACRTEFAEYMPGEWCGTAPCGHERLPYQERLLSRDAYTAFIATFNHLAQGAHL